MNYTELYIPVIDSEQAEIYIAELAEMPFESFDQNDTCLKAYIREDELEKCRVQVEDFIGTTGVECKLTTIETVNWNSVWESNFTPVEVEGKCAIRAPFHDAYPAFELDIVIMPKMSFGTGHHATTWLMTAELMEHRFNGQRGLDMGSGTGVLAIIAAKRGAAHIDAVDIDEWAYENSAENLAANGVEDKVTPILGDVAAIDGKHYDFILANINRNILLADMDKYVATLNGGGQLIMSGILEKDIPAISQKAESLGLSHLNTRLKDGWAAISYKK